MSTQPLPSPARPTTRSSVTDDAVVPSRLTLHGAQRYIMTGVPSFHLALQTTKSLQTLHLLQTTKSKSKIIYLPLPGDDPKQRKPDITKVRVAPRLPTSPHVPFRQPTPNPHPTRTQPTPNPHPTRTQPTPKHTQPTPNPHPTHTQPTPYHTRRGQRHPLAWRRLRIADDPASHC